ncbi:MAG: hypothetical protein ACD_62C00412G0001, partial [uncultured bacterium]
MRNFVPSILSLAVLLTCSVVASAQTTLRTPNDIVRAITASNYDLKAMSENTRAARATLNALKGSFYTPQISSTASYQDSQSQPLSPFEPASYQTLFWQTYLQSRTPYGVSVGTGHSFSRYHFGDASPPNPLLPYPITYYQPETYVQISLDLTQDFLGYLSSKQIEMAQLDADAAKLQEALVRHKFTALALDLYYQLPVLKSVRGYATAMISDFKALEDSLATKVERSLAEKSDLLGIQSTISSQQAALRDIDRTITLVETSLTSLLGLNQTPVSPQMTVTAINTRTSACENTITNTLFDPGLSQEFTLLETAKDKAALQAK